MKEFRRVAEVPAWKPAIIDEYGDREYQSFKDFCKSKDKENEVLYCLIRSRLGIIYCSKKAENITEKGVDAFDMDEFVRVLNKAARKYKLQELDLSDEVLSMDYKSIQYGIQETEAYGEKEYYPVCVITISQYDSKEWNKILSYFDSVDEKDKRYQIKAMPEGLSYLDTAGYYTTIIVTDIQAKYNRIKEN